MGVGIALAVGAIASAGVQAYGANQAGKAAEKSSAAAADRFESTGREGSEMLAKYEKLLGTPGAILDQTAKANEAGWGNALSQAGRLNTFNQSELDRMMQFSLPGYKNLINSALRNTKSWLRGEIPDDVSALVQQKSAESATRLGMPASSGNARALTARDLGRTSLDLMGQGENSLQRWIQTAKQNLVPTLHDPMEFLFTPTMTMNSTLSAANVAAQRAGILTGSQNNATNALIQGDQAKIAADQAMWKAISQGIEGIAGAAAGGMGGMGGAGGFSQSAQGIPNAGGVSGYAYSPQAGYIQNTGGGNMAQLMALNR